MAKNKLSEFEKTVEDDTVSISLNQKLHIVDEDIGEKKQNQADKNAKKEKQRQINFRISEADYERYNKLFGSKGISFSRAIRMWLDFGFNNIDSGKYDMSEAGIREVILNRLR